MPIGSSSVPRPRLNSRKRGDEEAHEDEEQAAEVARHRPAAPRRQRELDRRGDEGVRQRDEGVGREIGSRPERTDHLGIHAGRVDAEQDARLHGEQDHGVEHEGGEESPAEVLGLADGGGVDERMHPRRHVPRRRFAGDGRGHQKPDQAAEDRGFRDGEWRVDEEVVVQRVGEGVVSRHQESDDEQDGEDEPGPGTAYLVGELEAKDPPELHDATAGSGCSRRRPMCPAIVLK